MSGWPVAAACALACWDGEVSQQPMCPHRAQRRRWNHQPPCSSHSAQPVPLGGTVTSIGSAVTCTLLFPPPGFRTRFVASGIASGTHTRKPWIRNDPLRGTARRAFLLDPGLGQFIPLQERVAAEGGDHSHSVSPIVATMAALIVCNRFSAWSKTTEACDSKTSSVTSSAASPRLS